MQFTSWTACCISVPAPFNRMVELLSAGQPVLGRGRREMDPQRLVQVRSSNPGGSGSGYLIGPQLVLTALHTVAGGGSWARRIEARVGHPRIASGQSVREAQVCWPDPRNDTLSSDALDLALLWLTEPVAGSREPVRWGRPTGVVPVPFEAGSFPASTGDSSGAPQWVEHVRGQLSTVASVSSGWVLDCLALPTPTQAGERSWQGVSGSAVFSQGRLVGVVAEEDRSMDFRRLRAVPVHEALSLPGFADLVTRHGYYGSTTRVEEVTATDVGPRAVPHDVAWPVEVGPVPTLASAFQQRRRLRERLDAARPTGDGVVLAQVLVGGGGVGKTQLAAACATEALQEGIDLVVWAPAAEAEQVIAQYARAAACLQLPGVTGEPVTDARTLLQWLATTRRTWLVVLDDITHPEAVNNWWPASHQGTGRVLATTRLVDARLSGSGRLRVAIDGYAPEESANFLRERLAGEGAGHLLDDSAAALAETLGHLPLALGMAAAYMVNEELDCTAYLSRITDRNTRLEEAFPPEADAENYGRQLTRALLLAADAAERADGTGLAVPALRLAALLDPDGHPHALWTTQSFLRHLSGRRGPSTGAPGADVTANQAHSVLRLLHRYGLLTCDLRAEPRAVRMHVLTARAVRESSPSAGSPELTATAADALLEIWPDSDSASPDLAATLRANTDTLANNTGDDLWRPSGHAVLYRAGRSFLNQGLLEPAIAYWRHLASSAERLNGFEHPETLTIQANLAASYLRAGRIRDGIEIEAQVLADAERLMGSDHPFTLAARNNLAASYRQSGRTEEAIALQEQALSDSVRLFGQEHPDTLAVRANLAVSYGQAGRPLEAIAIEEQVVLGRVRVLGPEHPDTLTARANLAASYWRVGRTEEAITIEEQVLADRERVLGPTHPDAWTSRGNLAASYERVGRTVEALELLEHVVADRERVQGSDHPDALTARGNLAVLYGQVGRTVEAVELLEHVVADRERVQGSDHPDALTARANLAVSFRRAGRTAEALELLEHVVADRDRVLGSDHPGNLGVRVDLGLLYWRAGRIEEALSLLEQARVDSELVMGTDHPESLSIREVLTEAQKQLQERGGGA
ncbi:tetratricopeptide repeat protein [Streptomyces sp. NPDC002073]